MESDEDDPEAREMAVDMPVGSGQNNNGGPAPVAKVKRARWT